MYQTASGRPLDDGQKKREEKSRETQRNRVVTEKKCFSEVAETLRRRKKKRRKINIERKRHDDTPEIMLFLISVYCRFDLVRITIDSRKLISSLFLFKYALSLYDIFFNMFSFCFGCLLIFLLLLFLRKACETTHHRCYSLDVRSY